MNPNKNDTFFRLAIVVIFSFLVFNIWEAIFPSKNLIKNEVVSITKEEPIKIETKKLIKKKVVILKNDNIEVSLEPETLIIDEVFIKKYNKKILKPIDLENYKFITYGILDKENKQDNTWTVAEKGENYIILKDKTQNLDSEIKLELDDNYAVKITTNITGIKNTEVSFYSQMTEQSPSVTKNTPSHEGFVLYNNKISEIKYSDIKKNEKNEIITSNNSWLATSFKYWFIATKSTTDDNAIMSFNKENSQSNAVVMSKFQKIQKGEKIKKEQVFLIAPKEINYIDLQEKLYDMPMLDKVIDLGFFYFVAKPILYLLNYLNKFINNYGMSIILTTILVKIVLFFLSKSSYKSMQRMKSLQPTITQLKESYADKQALNQAIMALYKKEKINPISSMLPIFMQIPIFFAMYKVFSVAIEFRGQPFLWIIDLSKKDPTSFMNFFGALPFNAPEFLQIGILPIVMGVTMFLHQKLSANTTMNPEQQMVLNFMPLMFVFMFSSFSAGLMLYWITSNIFSILQQLLLNYAEKKKW